MASTRPAMSAIKTLGTAATPRGDDRQAQLLQIACRFFARYGYKGTSLRDIAEEAKITKAALYYHFPNKNTLYERIVLEGLRVLVEEVSEATDRATTGREKVRAFMMTTAEIFVRDPDLWTAGSNAFWVDEESVPRSAAIALRDRYEKLLRACIVQGVDAGEFKAVDPAIAGRVVLSVLNGLARWFRPDGRLTIGQVIDQYLDIILAGMGASAGTRAAALVKSPAKATPQVAAKPTTKSTAKAPAKPAAKAPAKTRAVQR